VGDWVTREWRFVATFTLAVGLFLYGRYWDKITAFFGGYDSSAWFFLLGPLGVITFVAVLQMLASREKQRLENQASEAQQQSANLEKLRTETEERERTIEDGLRKEFSAELAKLDVGKLQSETQAVAHVVQLLAGVIEARIQRIETRVRALELDQEPRVSLSSLHELMRRPRTHTRKLRLSKWDSGLTGGLGAPPSTPGDKTE